MSSQPHFNIHREIAQIFPPHRRGELRIHSPLEQMEREYALRAGIICVMRAFVIVILCAMSALSQTSVRLADVRKVYVDKMENNLDEYLRSSISKMFHGSLTIVLKREEADAILGGINAAAQRTQTATVTLTDPQGKVVLWSGTANDRSAKFLDLKHGGESKLADHLIGQLRKAMQR